MSKKEGKRVRAAINHTSPVIESSLDTAGDEEAKELWMIHWPSINEHFENFW